MADDQRASEDAIDWSEEAKGILKAELKRRNLTYAGLAAALGESGVDETEANLRNKISRGNFSAAFFLQSLSSIGCGVIHLSTNAAPPLQTLRARRVTSLKRQEALARQQEASDRKGGG